MMSIMIDAMQHQDVATANVAGAYLHAKLDNFTLLKMESESVQKWKESSIFTAIEGTIWLREIRSFVV
jgi:hypothetical protein